MTDCFNVNSKSSEFLVLSLLKQNFSLMSISNILFHYLKTNELTFGQNEIRVALRLAMVNKIGWLWPLIAIIIYLFFSSHVNHTSILFFLLFCPKTEPLVIRARLQLICQLPTGIVCDDLWCWFGHKSRRKILIVCFSYQGVGEGWRGEWNCRIWEFIIIVVPCYSCHIALHLVYNFWIL